MPVSLASAVTCHSFIHSFIQSDIYWTQQMSISCCGRRRRCRSFGSRGDIDKACWCLSNKVMPCCATASPLTPILSHSFISSQRTRHTQFWRLFKVKMNRILVSAFLPLLLPEAVILNSVTVTSYRKTTKTNDGPPMCALDPANDTMTSSSLQDCSLKCSQDSTCAGFNIKNWVICALYNYKPSIKERDATCEFYQVFIISNLFTSTLLRIVHWCTNCFMYSSNGFFNKFLDFLK